jgi:phosphate:Na+ symporter
MQTMMGLVDGALTEMQKRIAAPVARPTTSYKIEHEINNYRTQLKNQNMYDVNAGLYGYQLGVFYVDFISECEKLGDYVMNVVQAGKGLNNDYEGRPQS